MPGNQQHSWLLQPVFTARLQLRPAVPGDEGPIIGLVTDPEVREYLGGAMTHAQAQSAIRLTGERWGHFVITDLAARDVIGTVSFARKRGPWEVSYSLRRDRWGKGLMTEALRAAVAWFFAATADEPLIAVTQAANERSRRLLESVGAHFDGEFEQYGALQLQYAFSIAGAEGSPQRWRTP